MKNLDPVKSAQTLPFKRSTIYRFHSQKKYPDVIFKIDATLMWDWNAWGRRVEAARARQLKDARRLAEV